MSELGIERRNAARTEVDLPIRLSPQQTARPARLVNISTTGICCAYDEAINEMTMLGITLELPGQSRSAQARGVVVRCAKRRDLTPATYELGIFFTEMDPDSRRAIHDFVADRLERSAVSAPAPTDSVAGPPGHSADPPR